LVGRKGINQINPVSGTSPAISEGFHGDLWMTQVNLEKMSVEMISL